MRKPRCDPRRGMQLCARRARLASAQSRGEKITVCPSRRGDSGRSQVADRLRVRRLGKFARRAQALRS
jgi:hypothetical protein